MWKIEGARFITKTNKAVQFEQSGAKFWLPNRALVESRKHNSGTYTIITEDWFEPPVPSRKITLLELVEEVPPPKIEYTTGVAETDFPSDLIEVQREAVDFSVKLKRALIWLWTGSGKTKVGIEIANALFRNGKGKRLVWITPPMGIEQVKKSFLRWLDDSLQYDIMSMNWFSYNEREFGEDDIIIIDEAHRIKNGIAEGINVADCQLAENIRKSVYNAGYVYALTANTCLNGELDLFGIFFSLCRDIALDRDKKLRQYLKYKDNRPVAVRSLPDLIRRVAPYTFHRSKADYDKRVMYEHQYELTLTPSQSELMNRLYRADRRMSFRHSIVDTFTRMIECLHRAAGSVKMQQLLEVLRSIPEDDQIIIFGFTRQGQYSDIALAKDVCKQAKVSFIELHGGQTDEENRLAIDNFRKGKYRVLVSTYGCGAEMLDFPNANHVVLFGHSLNPIHRFQAKGRIDRIVQKKQCHLHNIYVKNSAEGYVNMLYNRKTAFSQDLSDFFKIDDFKILNNYDEQLS